VSYVWLGGGVIAGKIEMAFARNSRIDAEQDVTAGLMSNRQKAA
jgi:hypothetical protein